MGAPFGGWAGGRGEAHGTLPVMATEESNMAMRAVIAGAGVVLIKMVIWPAFCRGLYWCCYGVGRLLSKWRVSRAGGR